MSVYVFIGHQSWSKYHGNIRHSHLIHRHLFYHPEKETRESSQKKMQGIIIKLHQAQMPAMPRAGNHANRPSAGNHANRA